MRPLVVSAGNIGIRKIEVSTKFIDIWAIFEVIFICCIYFELFKMFLYHSLYKKLVKHSLKKLWQDEIISAPTARGRCMHVSITKGAGNLELSALSLSELAQLQELSYWLDFRGKAGEVKK